MAVDRGFSADAQFDRKTTRMAKDVEATLKSAAAFLYAAAAMLMIRRLARSA